MLPLLVRERPPGRVRPLRVHPPPAMTRLDLELGANDRSGSGSGADRGMTDTYPDVLSLDEDLRHQNGVALHPFPNLLLRLRRHEHVPLLELDHQRPQDLLHLQALVIRLPDDTHGRRVNDDFPGISVLVSLREKERTFS